MQTSTRNIQPGDILLASVIGFTLVCVSVVTSYTVVTDAHEVTEQTRIKEEGLTERALDASKQTYEVVRLQEDGATARKEAPKVPASNGDFSYRNWSMGR